MSTLESLSSLVTQLEQNKQNKITFYSHEPLSGEGADGDTRFVHIPGDGLFYYVKHNGHWYSRVFNEHLTTTEDEINLTITNVTETSTSFSSQTISGTLTVGGTSTFNGNVSFAVGTTISGLEYSDIGGTATGDPLPMYIKGSVFHDSDHFKITSPGNDGIGATAATINLAEGDVGGLRYSSGIRIDPSYEADGGNAWEQRHSFEYTSDHFGSLSLVNTGSRHMALKRGSVYGYLGVSATGDLALEPTAFKNVTVPNYQSLMAATAVVGASTSVVFNTLASTSFIGIDDSAEGDLVYVSLATGSTAALISAFNGKTMRVRAVSGTAITLQTTDLSSHGCTEITYGTGVAAGSLLIKQSGLRSTNFVSGWGGTGWDMGSWKPNSPSEASLEADNLTLRGTLSVYELLIQQIRATNGTVLISSCGKIDSITTATVGSEVVVMNDPGGHGAAPFIVGDILITQRVKVGGFHDPGTAASGQAEIIKRIVRRVAGVSGLNVTLSTASIDEPTDKGIYELGDELVRIGNTLSNADGLARQGSIKLTADEDNAPYIDIKSGVTSWALFNNVSTTKARLGNLDGITHNGVSLDSYGLYSQDAYLTGDIHATTGFLGGTTGWKVESNKLSSPTDGTVFGVYDSDTSDLTYGNVNSGFYMDGQGRFSLRDKVKISCTANAETDATSTTGTIELFGADDGDYLRINNDGIQMYVNSTKSFEAKASGEVVMGYVAANKGNIRVMSGDLEARINETAWLKVDGSAGAVYVGDHQVNNQPYLKFESNKLSFRHKDAGTGNPVTKIYMDSAGDLVASNKIVGAKIQTAVSNPKVLLGEGITSTIDNQVNNIIIGNWSGQTVGGSGSGILVKHGAGDFSKIGTTGFNRRGHDYPIHVYNGLHWGALWSGGQNGTEVNGANTLNMMSGGVGPTYPHEIRNIKIGYWLALTGYPNTVPTGRKLIYSMEVCNSCEWNYVASSLYVRPYHSLSGVSGSNYVNWAQFLHNDTYNGGNSNFHHTSSTTVYDFVNAVNSMNQNGKVYYAEIPAGTTTLSELKVLAIGLNASATKARLVVKVQIWETAA